MGRAFEVQVIQFLKTFYMGRNFIQEGDSIDIAIPAGGCESGGKGTANSTAKTPGVPVLVGADLVGIPDGSFDAGTSGNVAVHLEGVFGNIKLKTGDAPAIGDKLYFDNGNGYLTTSSSGTVWAGHAWSTADASGATTVVAIRLKG